MFDAELLRGPAVKHHLNQALDMMNHAVAGTFQPGARENMAYLISTERRCLLYINFTTQYCHDYHLPQDFNKTYIT